MPPSSSLTLILKVCCQAHHLQDMRSINKADMYFQKIIIAAAAIFAPLVVAVDDPDLDPGQGWNSAGFGQRGFTVCPEPNMEDGKRNKGDVCQRFITSEQRVKCQGFPTFDNVSPLESSPVPLREQIELTGL